MLRCSDALNNVLFYTQKLPLQDEKDGKITNLNQEAIIALLSILMP
jgi:hypothetical protein